jgi:hypothetical protein
MKLFAILALVSLCGCQTMGSNRAPLIQRVLDSMLPPTFVGDFDGAENIPMYVNFTLKAGNLKRDYNGNWTFDWLEYDRTGPLTTSAHIRLGKRP